MLEAREEQDVSSIDRMIRAQLGRFTLGLSPATLILAYLDWLVHLAAAPGKRMDLIEEWLVKMLRFAVYARAAAADPSAAPCIDPLPQDRRFAGPQWRGWPFNFYKIHLLSDTDVTFVLTNGGHNAGIVSEPGHPGRHYQITTRQAADKYLDPDIWRAIAPRQDGSWWPAWQAWFAASTSGRVSPPCLGALERGYPPLADGPGAYVLQG